MPGTTDHPRVSGEHLTGAIDREGINGSSPRERGALAHTRRHHETVRIIPA